MPNASSDYTLDALAQAPDAAALNSAIADLAAEVRAAPPEGPDADTIADLVSQHLERIFERERTIFVPPALPPLLFAIERSVRDKAPFLAALKDLRRGMGAGAGDGEANLQMLFQVMMLEAMQFNLDRAMSNFVRAVSAGPLPNWQGPGVGQVSAFLIEHHWLDRPLPQTARGLRKAARIKPRGAELNKLLVLIHAIGFSKSAARQHLDMVHAELIVPTMAAAAKARQFDIALYLEQLAYFNYTQAIDSAGHYRDTVSAWLPHMRACGRAFAATLPGPARAAGPVPDVPRVAFFLHGATVLGHTEVLRSFFRGLHHLPAKPIEPVLFVRDLENPELTRMMADVGVETVYLSNLTGPNTPMTELLATMRRQCAERDVTAVVYISLVLTMPFAFAMGMAPVQIWWSMKYHSIQFPEIDGYMALGSFDRFREIEGRQWRAVHRAMEPLFDSARGAPAAAVRADILGGGPGPVIGCIGREEKLVSPDYIAALARILERVPDAVFVWTGQSENAQVVDLLRANGIDQRCRFVGWIDTRLYAQVLDVFVDSFPFASGLTAFEALAAGCPVVAMLTPEALGTGMPAHVWPAYAGEAGDAALHREVRELFDDPDAGSLLPFTATVDDYVDTAVRLCTDPAFRGRAGATGRQFVERYMTNDQLMAESGCRHILEIIAAANGAPAPDDSSV